MESLHLPSAMGVSTCSVDTLRSLCNEEGVTVVRVILLVEVGFVALVRYEHLCGRMVGVALQKQTLRFALRQIEAVFIPFSVSRLLLRG